MSSSGTVDTTLPSSIILDVGHGIVLNTLSISVKEMPDEDDNNTEVFSIRVLGVVPFADDNLLDVFIPLELGISDVNNTVVVTSLVIGADLTETDGLSMTVMSAL